MYFGQACTGGWRWRVLLWVFVSLIVFPDKLADDYYATENDTVADSKLMNIMRLDLEQ